jgi:hypothetical protein
MLDWPAQLFNDNATIADLVAEDSALPCAASPLSCDRDIYAQAAA